MPEFIKEQLSPGEKVKSVISQRGYIILRQTLVFTDRRLIIHRGGFWLNAIKDYPYGSITSVHAEKTRPIECLASFLISLYAIYFYYTNVDFLTYIKNQIFLMYFIPSQYPLAVYFSVLAAGISAGVVAYYLYRDYGKWVALITIALLLGILLIAWYEIHFVLPIISTGLVQFVNVNFYAEEVYYPALLFGIQYSFAWLAANTVIEISTIYGIFALIAFIIRLSIVLLNIENGEIVSIRPYNPEIIKMLRQALKP